MSCVVSWYLPLWPGRMSPSWCSTDSNGSIPSGRPGEPAEPEVLVEVCYAFSSSSACLPLAALVGRESVHGTSCLSCVLAGRVVPVQPRQASWSPAVQLSPCQKRGGLASRILGLGTPDRDAGAGCDSV